MGPSLASFTMSRNLWLPFWINIALLMCAVPIVGMIPDPRVTTLIIAAPTEVDDDDGAAAAAEDDENDEEVGPLLGDREFGPRRFTNAFEAEAGLWQNITLALRRTIRLTYGRRNFQILLCSFFFTALASSDTKLLVQYISKRYLWTFAEVCSESEHPTLVFPLSFSPSAAKDNNSHSLQAGYLLSAKALVNFTLLALLIPRLIAASTSSKAVRGSETRLNILGAQTSIFISVLGVLCIALSIKFWMLLAGSFRLLYCNS